MKQPFFRSLIFKSCMAAITTAAVPFAQTVMAQPKAPGASATAGSVGRHAGMEIVRALAVMAVGQAVGNAVNWTEAAHFMPESSDPAIQRYRAWADGNARALRGEKQRPIPGAITSFFVSFPMECASVTDFTRAFSAETSGYDTSSAPKDAIYPALNWMLYESTGNNGRVLPLERIYSGGYTVTYLTTRIVMDAKAPVRAMLEIPSATPVTAWVNGTRALSQTEDGPDTPLPFGDRHEITLRPGDNILTIKVAFFDREPEFYAFLSEKMSGAPLAFSIDNSRPITVDFALDGSHPAPAAPAILREVLDDATVGAGTRAWLAKAILPAHEAHPMIRALLQPALKDALPPDETELAVLSLDDPGKSLQILRRALQKYPDDARLSLLYARQLILNSEAQGDTGSRFADESAAIRNAISRPAPTHHGISYEPLKQKLAALETLNHEQILMALKQLENNGCAPCFQTLFPLISNHLADRKKIREYRHFLQQWLESQRNASHDIVEDLEKKLIHAVSGGDKAQIGKALDETRSQVEAFFERHPYDEYMWHFWLGIVENYGSHASDAPAAGYANFTTDAESWYLSYLSQRINDPGRWLRHADYLLRSKQTAEAIDAYEMAARLRPQDESLRERVATLKSMNHGNAKTPDADASFETAFETPYVVKDIPAAKDKTAPYIVSLIDNRIVRILPNGLSSTFNQIAFEIMDEQGVKALRAMPINYSPIDEKLEIISVTTTKKDGTVRRLYNTTEYNTADESIRMYYDQRQIVIEIPDLSVGDRVEYRFKRTQMQRSASSIAYFSDLFQLQATFPRQWSRYTVIAPENMPVRFFKNNPRGISEFANVKIERGSHTAVMSYQEHDAQRLIQEEQMPGVTEIAPFLLVSSFLDWQSVANWFLDLAKPQWKADDAIRKTVAELTDGITDPLEKLKRIHNFVVKSTRYVALEFGIHGHKPYPVSQVFERRFGDCKDKASLLKVMLREAGIESHFVLVRTRPNGDISMELPNAYLFDHAIVYVPQFDMFLDGTAEFSGTRELPAADQNAWMFIIHDDDAYELRKSPLSTAENNRSTHHWTFDLTAENQKSIRYRDEASYSGIMAPSYRERYQVLSFQKDRLESEYAYAIAGTHIRSFQISDLSELESDVKISIDAETDFSGIVKTNGNIWIIRRGIMPSNLTKIYAPSARRTYPIAQYAPVSTQQTIEIRLPSNAIPELPPPASMSTKHGSWKIESNFVDSILTTKYTISLREIEISPEDYAGFQEFLQQFDKALNTPCTITLRH